MKQTDPVKCRICLNLEKGDRGLLNFGKKCKIMKKFKYNEADMAKVCNCSQVHKFCILKFIIVSQSLACRNCHEPYKIKFIENSSFCKRLVTYKFLGELLFVILSVLACIASIFTNGFYTYSSAFSFWRQVVFILLSLIILFCCILIFRMLFRMKNEKFVEAVSFNEQLESKLSIIKPITFDNNDQLINLKSRDSIIQFIDNKKVGKQNSQVKRESDQQQLKYIFGILMCDFGLNKKEILQLKVEYINSSIINNKREFSSQAITSAQGSLLKQYRSKDIVKVNIEIKPIALSGKKVEEISPSQQMKPADSQPLKELKQGRNSNSKMLLLQDDLTQNVDRDNATTNVDLGCTLNRSKLPFNNTQDFIRLTSENSVFDRTNDNRELVLNISEDESFKLHNRDLKTPFNLTSNESGIFLNQSKDIIIQ